MSNLAHTIWSRDRRRGAKMDNNSNAKVGARLAFLERSLELLNAQMQLFEHAHKNQECHDVFVGPVPATPKQRLDAYALEVS